MIRFCLRFEVYVKALLDSCCLREDCACSWLLLPGHRLFLAAYVTASSVPHRLRPGLASSLLDLAYSLLFMPGPGLLFAM